LKAKRASFEKGEGKKYDKKPPPHPPLRGERGSAENCLLRND